MEEVKFNTTFKKSPIARMGYHKSQQFNLNYE